MIAGNGHAALSDVKVSPGAALFAATGLRGGIVYLGKLEPSAGDGPTLVLGGTASENNPLDQNTTIIEGPLKDSEFRTLALNDKIELPNGTAFDVDSESALFTIIISGSAGGDALFGKGLSPGWRVVRTVDGIQVRLDDGVNPVVVLQLAADLWDGRWQIVSLLFNYTAGLCYVADDHLNPAAVLAEAETLPALSLSNGIALAIGAGSSAFAPTDGKCALFAAWPNVSGQLDLLDERTLVEHNRSIRRQVFTEIEDGSVDSEAL